MIQYRLNTLFSFFNLRLHKLSKVIFYFLIFGIKYLGHLNYRMLCSNNDYPRVYEI